MYEKREMKNRETPMPKTTHLLLTVDMSEAFNICLPEPVWFPS